MNRRLNRVAGFEREMIIGREREGDGISIHIWKRVVHTNRFLQIIHPIPSTRPLISKPTRPLVLSSVSSRYSTPHNRKPRWLDRILLRITPGCCTSSHSTIRNNNIEILHAYSIQPIGALRGTRQIDAEPRRSTRPSLIAPQSGGVVSVSLPVSRS